jgi:glycosyltransferase involved in cell wall biosynthesis
MWPKVSIIIPTNRYDEYLIRSVNSVLSQTLEEIEVLIIVNGPKAVEISKLVRSNYSDTRLIVHTISTRFINFSLAYGVEIAKSEFVARLDSDDYMVPDRLREQYEFLNSNPDFGIVGSFVQLIRGDELVGVRMFPLNDTDIRKTMPFRSPFCHPAIMIRRKYLFEIGSYMGGILAEDYDLYVRLILFTPGCKFHNLSKILTYYSIDDGEAKRARRAYISMISTQSFAFFYSGGITWLFAIVISFTKLLLNSNKE